MKYAAKVIDQARSCIMVLLKQRSANLSYKGLDRNYLVFCGLRTKTEDTM